MACNNAVADSSLAGNGRRPIRVLHKPALLNEAPWIKQQIEPLASRKLATLVLLFDLGRATPFKGEAVALLKLLKGRTWR
jgi:hypothetical protein